MLQPMPFLLAQDDDLPPRMPGAPQTGTTEAQDGSTPGAGPSPTPRPGMGPQIWLFVLLAMVLMWIFMMGGSRKEKKKRASMLAALAKGDRVQTAGGILGTVVEVREQEVVVKVDENTNSRLRFARTAIQSIVEDKPQ